MRLVLILKTNDLRENVPNSDLDLTNFSRCPSGIAPRPFERIRQLRQSPDHLIRSGPSKGGFRR